MKTKADIQKPDLVQVADFNDQQKELHKLAIEAKKAGDQFADKWRAVVAFVHSKQMPPEQITPVLLDAGFPPSRASEIKMIAQAPPEIYKRYQAKELGFRPAVEKARENSTRRTSSGKTLRNRAWTAFIIAGQKLFKRDPKFTGASVYLGKVFINANNKDGDQTFEAGTLKITVSIKETVKK